MHDFTFTLPPETIASIFRHLEKSDCLECMHVCRRWYNTVPDYARELWTQLRIAHGSWHRPNSCMLQCIGPHVRNVSIREFHDTPVSVILNRLKHKECKIIYLEIQGHSRLREMGTAFLGGITHFGSTLKELCISNANTSGLSELHLLDNCPHLTHLTLLFSPLAIDVIYPPEVNIEHSNSISKLLYLHLDTAGDFDSRVATMIGRSPKLRALVISNHPYRKFHDTYRHGVYLESILEHCPCLRYLALNEYRLPFEDAQLYDIWKEYVDREDGNASMKSLLGLVFRGGFHGATKMIPLLKQSQDTLRYLKFLDRGTHRTEIAGFRFPCLETLILPGVKMPQEQWTTFFTGCSNLKRLDIGTLVDTMILEDIFPGVNSLKQLQHMRLTSAGNIIESPINAYDMLSINALETLHVSDANISDQGLISLCHICTLRELRLTIPRNESYISTEGLLTFAKNLNTADRILHTLEFWLVASMTDEVLHYLAQVKSLSMLSVSFACHITDVGVQEFVNKNKKFRVASCTSVSKQGLWEKGHS
ncbi:hypothetical protein BJV82DRAFT_590657 [Fennellomyces sp. T-0311]|nr:hypothetical protein BJV82DRAFT_590657 [Fennellomyces sp. T-0311]